MNFFFTHHDVEREIFSLSFFSSYLSSANVKNEKFSNKTSNLYML